METPHEISNHFDPRRLQAGIRIDVYDDLNAPTINRGDRIELSSRHWCDHGFVDGRYYLIHLAIDGHRPCAAMCGMVRVRRGQIMLHQASTPPIRIPRRVVAIAYVVVTVWEKIAPGRV